MEFRQIQYFLCLFEEGAVTRAARRLNIVQPALSMQIAKLEDEVGLPLFLRSPQGMLPTAEARRMYKLFKPVMGDFARAREQMLLTGAELSGHVRVGMIATIAQGVLVEAMLEFSSQHPQVLLSLTDGFSGNLIDAVSVGQLDAAIINKPRRPLALTSEPLGEEELLLVCNPQHPPLADTLPLSEVAKLKLVLPTRQHGLRGILESLAQTEDIDLQPAAEIDAISALLKLVGTSDFCCLLPRIAVHRQLQTSELRGHHVERPRLVRQIICLTHPRRQASAAASAFLAVLTRRLREALSSAAPVP